MKKILLLCALFLTFQSFGQQLQFSTIGSDPAYCRLFSYQSGNGAVYAAATGGTPSYTYQLTNLTSGGVHMGSTWGGLNPGDYEVKVWDALGDSIVQIVTVDSLNPLAVIGVVPGSITGNDPIYTGSAPVTVEFINQSQYFANPNNPIADTTFFWRFTQFDSWVVRHDIIPNEQFTYSYGGDWEVSLVAMNKNGCVDTAQVFIWLLGESGVEDLTSVNYSLITNPDQNKLIISSQKTQAAEIRIYDLSGKLIQTTQINSTLEQIGFEHRGIFVYKVVDPNKGEVLQSGKFSF